MGSPEIYTRSRHNAFPIPESAIRPVFARRRATPGAPPSQPAPLHRSEEHTSELKLLAFLVCRLNLNIMIWGPRRSTLVHDTMLFRSLNLRLGQFSLDDERRQVRRRLNQLHF